MGLYTPHIFWKRTSAMYQLVRALRLWAQNQPVKHHTNYSDFSFTLFFVYFLHTYIHTYEYTGTYFSQCIRLLSADTRIKKKNKKKGRLATNPNPVCICFVF